MEILLIRHGETEDNKHDVHQTPFVPLSPEGREQARRAGERLKALGITKLVTSDLARAKETADIIAAACGIEPELHPIFREVTRPSALYGKSYYHPLSLLIGADMLLHLQNENWHYADEENLYDIRFRVAEAVDYLRELGEENDRVAVVTHAFILNMFIKYMCAYKGVRIRDYLGTLFVAKRLKNASISTVCWNDDGNPNTCDWLCTDLNNTSHLT
jgi:probable phosphoglycerate mutase